MAARKTMPKLESDESRFSFLHKFLDSYHRKVVYLDQGITIISSVFFVVAVGATLAGAVGRQFPQLLPDVTWASEVTTLSMITAVLLVVARGLRENTQMAVTMLPERLSDRGFQILTFFVQILVIIFFWVVVRYGIDVMNLNRSQTTPILGLSLWWPYLIVVITGVLMLLESVIRLVEAALGRAPRAQAGLGDIGVE